MSTLKVNVIQTNTGSGVDINSPLETVPSIDVTGSASVGGNLRVNNILPSVGTNVAIGTAGGSVTLTGSITGSSITNTGTTVVAAGTTSAPSISPTGDSNTGIFFPSPDTVAIAEGGVEALRITSSGDIGIGTAIPSNYFSYDLVVKSRQNTGGVTIAANSTSDVNYLMFADGTSGNAAYRGYINYVHSDDSLNIASAGSVRATLTSTGNLQLANGNLVFSTAGTGIDFSATANSSGSMTSELLSDYEEGTWTPVDADGDAYATNKLSTYTRVGRLVWAMCDVSATSTANGSKIGGLPFTAFGQSGTSFAGNYPCFNGYTSGPDARMNGHINSGTTQITLFVGSTETSLTNGQRIIITALYLA